jgi:hypothetical protein
MNVVLLEPGLRRRQYFSKLSISIWDHMYHLHELLPELGSVYSTTTYLGDPIPRLACYLI